MLCSKETRDLIRDILRKMNKPIVVFLSEKYKRISKNIALFTYASLAKFRDRFADVKID
jgi:hypothetical protein